MQTGLLPTNCRQATAATVSRKSKSHRETPHDHTDTPQSVGDGCRVAADRADPAVRRIPCAPPRAPAGKQAAGWYRYKIGSIEVTVATDGVARFKMAEDHVINIKKDVVNAALAEVFMEKDMMTTPYNPICVNTGSKLAVIDTGTGEANYKKSNGVGGQFVSNLAAAGIDRTAVDTVIISHYHGDHINGLLMADNSLTYPNAEILVPAPEHKYWMDDGEMSRASKGRIEGQFQERAARVQRRGAQARENL